MWITLTAIIVTSVRLDHGRPASCSAAPRSWRKEHGGNGSCCRNGTMTVPAPTAPNRQAGARPPRVPLTSDTETAMALPAETNPEFADYAHPERLVSTDWLAQHLGEPGLVVVESDEDVLLYDTGHIPGSVKIDWHTDLNDPVVRDYVSSERFAELLGSKGIARDTTVVIYGDKNNWWAAYALWVFTLFGHEDVRLLDGGRDKWIAEGRELTREATRPDPVEYPVVERDDSVIRAFKEDVLAHLGLVRSGGGALIDVRSPEEYSGER